MSCAYWNAIMQFAGEQLPTHARPSLQRGAGTHYVPRRSVTDLHDEQQQRVGLHGCEKRCPGHIS